MPSTAKLTEVSCAGACVEVMTKVAAPPCGTLAVVAAMLSLGTTWDVMVTEALDGDPI